MSIALYVQIQEAIHAEHCTAYQHEGRNALCERIARTVMKVLDARPAATDQSAAESSGSDPEAEVGRDE